MNILQYREMVKETDLYLPMLQPLQYAKGWKKRPKGYIAIADLRSCLQKDCEHRPGKFGYHMKPPRSIILVFDSRRKRDQHGQ